MLLTPGHKRSQVVSTGYPLPLLGNQLCKNSTIVAASINIIIFVTKIISY